MHGVWAFQEFLDIISGAIIFKIVQNKAISVLQNFRLEYNF